MLQPQNIVSMGGLETFAADASQVCVSVVSRHSDNREAGFLSAERKTALAHSGRINCYIEYTPYLDQLRGKK